MKFNILEYGAIGDGEALNTIAVQKQSTLARLRAEAKCIFRAENTCFPRFF